MPSAPCPSTVPRRRRRAASHAAAAAAAAMQRAAHAAAAVAAAAHSALARCAQRLRHKQVSLARAHAGRVTRGAGPR